MSIAVFLFLYPEPGSKYEYECFLVVNGDQIYKIFQITVKQINTLVIP